MKRLLIGVAVICISLISSTAFANRLTGIGNNGAGGIGSVTGAHVRTPNEVNQQRKVAGADHHHNQNRLGLNNAGNHRVHR
jgi:hypothetical protein